MKTRKTKKRNIIRRTVAFLLCMTMVLGLGMQDVIEQVYAEGVSAVSQEQSALETQNVESTEAVTPEEEIDPTDSGEIVPVTPEEEPTAPEEDKEPTEPANPADTEENTDVTTPPTETTEPSAPAEPTTPADGTENTKPTEPAAPAAPETPADSNGSGSSDDMTPGGGTGTDEQKPPVEEDTKEEPVSELTYAAEDGSFSVKAEAVSEDVELSGIEIHASQVQKDSEEYAAAEELVAGVLDAESCQIEELQAYDIWFTYTENGETADLSGQVQISLEYTAPEFPEGTDAQLEVFCLNGGAAEAVDGTDALAAGCELYALVWAVPAESTDTWEWTDDQVIIKASAEKGVLPEGAEISVTPIVKTEEEELANLSEEERAEAEAINEQYAQTEEKLTEDLEVQAAEEAATLPAAEADVAAVDAASDSEETADAATAKTLEGFLAYDICFLVNGEEVEPADGEVNVSIEFNEAVIPEGVSEDAEVSVAHLKEEKNENGEDEIVVEDLTAAETTTVETTDKAEVKKVELVTESFSTFTIIWSNNGNRTLKIELVDSSENSIDASNWNDEVWLGDGERTVESIARDIDVPEGYTFTGAYVGYSFGYKTQILRLRWNNGWFNGSNQYSTQASGNDWDDIGSYQTVWFVYDRIADIETIDTVDSRAQGITLNLFDYWTNYDGYNKYQDGINSGKDFKFTDGSSNDENGLNKYHSGTDSTAVFDDIFRNNMGTDSDGNYTYPVFSDGINGGSDASYLFSTENDEGKTVYADVNRLFTLDADGYYRYDSSKNYAYYNTDSRNFSVYNVPAAPDGTADCYMKGNFFPFNILAADSRLKDSSTGLRNFETGTGATNKNVHFGMTMDASFVQPAEGKVNDKNMVFNFTGDDDVWVFIDGVLVLDIGGVHDALDGSIDFNTGTVKVTGQEDTTLKELFEAADRDTSDFSGNTFADYTEHTINFYYLERGEGASNCKLEFNIQTVPEDSVIVEKQLGVSGVENNEEFTFKAQVSNDGNDWTALEEGSAFTITNTDGTESVPGTVGENGTFRLKAGQRAVFDGIEAGTYFRATEVANSNYTTVVNVTGNNGSVDGLTGQLTVQEKRINRILFINTPNSSSLLNYEKNVEGADCDERVYKVNLGASTLGSTAGTEGESASIVMVLDASSSLSDNTFASLKNAAVEFVTTAQEKASGEHSGEIEIAVVWYKGTQGSSDRDDPETVSSSGFKDVSDEQSVQALTAHINQEGKRGGTPMGAGLGKAEELLNAAKYSNKYVLLFTDGRPGFYDSSEESYIRFNCMVANDASNHAANIKGKDATIYTVGYGNELNESFSWYPGDSGSSSSDSKHVCDEGRGGYYPNRISTTGNGFLSNYIASDGCDFTTANDEQLNDIFQDIAGSIGSDLTTQTDKIMDVVDERFNLLFQDNGASEDSVVWENSGNKYRLAQDGDIITDSLNGMGIVSYDETTKTYTITWSGVEIPNTNKGGWGASFYIKAKEDFIGGNVVPTNGTDSGIYLPGNEVIHFPMPTVNVKLLTPRSGNQEAIYFKGETVEPKEFIDELLKTAEIEELVEGSNGENIRIPVSDVIHELTEQQKAALVNGETVNIRYSYGNTNDFVGNFTLKFKVKEAGKGNLLQHQLVEEGDDVESYVLDITYTADSVADRETEHEGWMPPVVCDEVEDVSTYPEYIIDVVAGTITIRKTVSAEDLEAALDVMEQVTFTFKIEGTDKYNPSYDNIVEITFKEEDLNGLDPNATEVTKSAEIVSGLSQDEYTVSEEDVTGFEAEKVEARGLKGSTTPIKEATVNESDLTATLKVGLPNTEAHIEEYINYRDGEVTFKNKRVTNKWQIVKVSSSGNDITLEGAQFELIPEAPNGKTYIGTSNENGIITWTYEDKTVVWLEKGTYTLKETGAPSGYQLSDTEWTVTITPSGALESIVSKDGSNITSSIDPATGMVSYFYTNEVLYDLPEAGGPGIHLYMLGGTLLMMAGALLVYKKRKEEVLRS